MNLAGEGTAYRFLEALSNVLVLNLLWILACLPIITIYPATVALFGVVGEWVRDDRQGVSRRYLSILRRDFKQSFGVGVIWTLLGTAILAGALEIRYMESTLVIPVSLVMFIISITYISGSVFLFPVMATFDLRTAQVLKNSILMGLSFPITTISCLGVLLVAGLVVYTMPIFALVAVSLSCYAVSWLCHRAFDKLNVSDREGEHNPRTLSSEG
jgi:uncharacterized membrane protein YesL